MELVADWWKSSLANDHYLCLRQKELRQLPTYHARSPQLGVRLHIVDWLAIICDATGVCLTARHLAVALLDYFMDHFVVEKCHLTLVALSCLLIAAKFEECENNIPKLSELNRLSTSSRFTSRQYLSMELRVLQFFDWSIGLPTAAHFLEYFLVEAVTSSDCFEGQSLGSQATAALPTVTKYVTYFLEISLQDASFRSCRPSQVCAACIAAARHCLRLSPTWLTRLQHRTGYTWTDLQPLVSLMLVAHERDERKRSAQTLDRTTSATDVSGDNRCLMTDSSAVTGRDSTVNGTMSSPDNQPVRDSAVSSAYCTANGAVSSMHIVGNSAAMPWGSQMFYCVQPSCNILTVGPGSYTLAQAWTTGQ